MIIANSYSYVFIFGDEKLIKNVIIFNGLNFNVYKI